MRRAVLIYALVLVAGCKATSTTSPHEGVPATTSQPAHVDITIVIDGVKEYASPSYGVSLDGAHFITIASDTEFPLIIAPGAHKIGIEETYGLFPQPPWCRAQAPQSYSQQFPGGKSTPLTFHVNCPVITDDALLTIHPVATGRNIPDHFEIQLTRGAVPKITRTVSARINETSSFPMPWGIYSLTVTTVGCRFTTLSASASIEATIQSSGTTQLTPAVSCQ